MPALITQLRELGKPLPALLDAASSRPAPPKNGSHGIGAGTSECVLISASIDAYLDPWSKLAGFDHVICSRLETTPAGNVTGRLVGLNCWGPEKVRRLEELFGPLKKYTLYAYGDSRGDKELLAGADYPFSAGCLLLLSQTEMEVEMNHFRDVWQLMRPLQWIKNGFVFVGVLFSQRLASPETLLNVCLAALAFCLASSCVYVFNDIIDCANDRQHPKKCHRPLPAGKVSLPFALALALSLGMAGTALGIWISPAVAAIIVSYLLLNAVYSLWLKHIVILDVFCIAAGFMLRILAGTIGVGVPPSKWLLLCSLMLTLFLGFAKRRAEINLLADFKQDHRRVLRNYSTGLLDQLIGICATAVIISYSLYTMSPETINIHTNRKFDLYSPVCHLRPVSLYLPTASHN